MFLARIDGTITSTAKHSSFSGCRLLIGQRLEQDGSNIGEPQILIDTLGAGFGSMVIVSSDGDFARTVLKDNRTPSRMMIVGIVDSVNEERP